MKLMGRLNVGWGGVLAGLAMVYSIEASAMKSPYNGRIQLSGSGCEAHRATLESAASEACFRVHRAFYALNNFEAEIQEMYGSGIMMPVVIKNIAFYRKHLGKRLEQCTSGTLYLTCTSSKKFCNDERETAAYVLTTFGFPAGTINFCPRYFRSSEGQRFSDMAHEFGRLEGIGDDEQYTTDSIAVWDRLLDTMRNDVTYDTLAAMHSSRNPRPEMNYAFRPIFGHE